MRIGHKVTIHTYIEYDLEEDSVSNNKTPGQLRTEVSLMSKSYILDVLESVRGISVPPGLEDTVTTEYYEEV